MPWTPMTKNQRDWVVRRDGNRCQKRRFVNGVWFQCERNTGLHVHHIFPKGALAEWSSETDPNTPDNLITLCGDKWNDAHHISEVGVHQDLAFAKKDYARGDKNAYTRVFNERALLLKRGRPYWFTLWDLIFSKTAVKNTERYQQIHPEDRFPPTKRKK